MAENITTTALNDAMKIVWAPGQKKQFNDTGFLWTKIKKTSSWRLGGRQFEGSVKKRGGGSFRTMLEGEQLPRPDSPAYDLFHVVNKTAASRYRITVEAMKASKGNERAWVDGQMDAANFTVSQTALRMSQMMYRTGTGAVARVNGVPTATTFIVDDSMTSGSGNTFGVQYLEEGMQISASANTTGNLAERTFDGRITNIDPDTFTITFDGPVGDLTDNDYIFIGEPSRTSKNRDWMGLLGIIDDGTIIANLQDIDRTAAGGRFWKSNRYASVGSADLENAWQTASDDIYRKGLGHVDAIITTFGARKRYGNDLKGDRRFVAGAESGEYSGGFKSLKWMDGNNKELELWVDKDCPKGVAFLVSWDSLHLAWLQEPEWWDAGGGVLQRVDNTLALEATYYAMGNLGTDQPNTNAVLLGITED